MAGILVASCTTPTPPVGDINEPTTTASRTRSSIDPTVAAPGSTAAATASVKPAGINVLLPSGNTTSNSTAPCRRILPNTRNDLPCKGCRVIVTITDGGKSSIPVVRRVFLR